MASWFGLRRGPPADASVSTIGMRRGVRHRTHARAAAYAVSSVLALMEACIPALRRYAGALLRDRQEVDDLVHDCLVLALARLHTRRGDADLRAWLFAIMHNLYVSRFRRRRVRGEAASLDKVPGGRL